MSGSEYLFENAAPEAADRFSALAMLFDPVTIRHFEALGITEGWDCLELGAGGGSIARWLSKRVGSSGHVLATDLDVRWLSQQDHDANLEIRHHDLVKDPLPDRSFDLVHERLVLIHVPERRGRTPTNRCGTATGRLAPGRRLLVPRLRPIGSPTRRRRTSSWAIAS